MIACPNCRTIQPVERINTGHMEACPGCGVALRMDVFNAFMRTDAAANSAESIIEPGQSECFYHPGKQAQVACEACGRLLCAVCRVDLNDRPICMRCLQAGRDKQKITILQNRRVLYDHLAFILAFWPMLAIFPTLVTAPAAIYFAIRHWRTPSAFLPKGWFKNSFALLLAVLQCAGWITFFVVKFG